MNAYQKITSHIIDLLEVGTVPWHKPWVDGPAIRSFAGRSYRGINRMLLSVAATQRGLRGCWLTFNQATKLGGRIKKGAKGHPVVYWKWFDEKDDEGEPTGKQYPVCRFYTVFSICHTQDLSEPKWVAEIAGASVPSVPTAEEIWEAFADRPNLIQAGDSAAYHPSVDQISMPDRNQFDSPEVYYNTFFHEMVHSTGHKSRLKRHHDGRFGSEAYSKEELVAEMGAAFLACEAGIDLESVTTNSAAYIQSWIHALKGDSTLAVRAAGHAQKAADYILNLSDGQRKSHSLSHSQ